MEILEIVIVFLEIFNASAFIVVWIILLFPTHFQYTEELLRQQQFLEVFLEGTRSRSGKPSPARAGMLSIVVDTLCVSSIPDVLIVPVGISYDRIIEGNYNSEQLVGSLWLNSPFKLTNNLIFVTINTFLSLFYRIKLPTTVHLRLYVNVILKVTCHI